MKKQVPFALMVVAFSAPLSAQTPKGQTNEPVKANEMVAGAMGAKFTAAKCSPKGDNHFMVSSVKSYYASYFEAKDAANKPKFLRSAVDAGKRAILENQQDKNGGAWYWLGRIYLQQGDVPGADSALARAEALLPECAQEIKSYRQVAYQSLISPAVQKQREGKLDSAVAMYREAEMMSKNAPTTALGLAIIFNSRTPPQTDSAIAYFVMAQAKASLDATRYAKERESATVSLVSLYYDKEMWPQALAEARKLVAWAPAGDLEAKRKLLPVLVNLKDAASVAEATALRAELLAAAEADGSMTATDFARFGVDHFNSKNYAKAIEYFNKALAKEPWRRDVLYNLINSYFATENYPDMMAGLEKQHAAEPMNGYFLQMMVEASKKLGNKEKTLEIATKLFTLTTSLTTQGLIPTEDGASVVAEAVGMEGSHPTTGKPLPMVPITLVVEFLDKTGAVMGTTEVTIPALTLDQKSNVVIKGVGKGIADWRYTIKPKP